MDKELVNENQSKELYGWQSRELRLIRDTVAKNATVEEFKLFLYTANKYGLDPLVKQVWFVKYNKNDVGSIFTGRDGFLSIAHRSGQFDGMDTDAIYSDDGGLEGAMCIIWRKDMSHPFTVKVKLSEYSKGQANWKSMPETMIKKVAESQCLRKAFNISGIYSPEEDWHTTDKITHIDPDIGPDMDAEYDNIQSYDAEEEYLEEPPVEEEPAEAPDEAPDTIAIELLLDKRIAEIAGYEQLTVPIMQRRFFKYAAKAQGVQMIGSYADLNNKGIESLDYFYHSLLKKHGK